MQQDNPQSHRRKRKKSSPSTPFLLATIALVGIVIGSYYYQQKSQNQPSSPVQVPASDSAERRGESTLGPESLPIDQADTSPATAPADNALLPTETAPLQDVTTDKYVIYDHGGDTPTGLDQSTEHSPSGNGCQAAANKIAEFYRHLDRQEYLTPFQLDEPSDIYFSALIQKLADNPPIVSGETSDLFNILKNTAHFFRIVGKDNIIILKAILDREKDSFEQVLAEFYKLTANPQCLEDAFYLTISKETLYEYAGFFLNTMGGRLYLFRRDSMSRMVVSYYSILIIDESNVDDTNRHGLDVRPAIDSLIDELENTGNRLRLKEDYLDNLYDLKEKYGP